MSGAAASILPDFDMTMFIISISLCSLLGFFSYMKKILDLKGTVLAVVVGMLLIGYSDFFWFLLMVFFFTITYLVTIWKYKKKSALGLGEGGRGERGIKNVIANGIVPVAIAIFSTPLNNLSDGLPGFLFIVAIAVSTSDTFASEIGVMSKYPRMITKPSLVVDPGVDGGVSLLGNIAAFFGGLLVSVSGYFLITDYFISTEPHLLGTSIWIIIIPVILGWLGCQVDSVLGATLQRRGVLTNNLVNFVTVLICVVATTPFFIILS
ncbi:MAG: DUF92 domain-containing protein [Thermoplasmatota archaeon]